MALSKLFSDRTDTARTQQFPGFEDAAYLQDPPSLEVLCRLVVPRVSSRWDYVGLQLGVSPERLDVIEGEHKRKDDCCTAMFKEWLQGAPGTRNKKRSWESVLCAVETGHGTTAEKEIRKGLREVVAQPDYQAAALSDKLTLSDAALLKEQAYSEYREFTLGDGPNDSYVKLAVLKRPPSARPEDVAVEMHAMEHFKNCGSRLAEENATHITPVDFLKKGSERVRVVYGQAGSGKTTLLKHMCKALSRGEVDSEFDLVLYFPLREASVSSAGDLQSLLKYYLRDEDEVRQSVKEFNRSKGRGFLLVLDGADEVKDLLELSSGSIVQSILERRDLPEAHIIISSRPGACPSLQDHKYKAVFYEIQGFNRDNITSYVRTFFKANPPAADSMLSQLRHKRPDLLGGMYIPMNCFILCSIFDVKSSSFPPTMTACYQAFVRQIICRECREKEKMLYLDPLLRYALLPGNIRFLLASLGALSFKGLCESPPVFIFDELSIRSTFPQELLPLGAPIDEYLFKGLLHLHASKRGFESLHSFSFPHGTQQEFFGALYLSQLEEVEQAQFWKKNLFNVTFSVVLRFFAGLTGLSNPQMAEQICCTLSGAAEDGSHSRLMGVCSRDDPRLLFLFHALCESQNTKLTKRFMQNIPSSLKFDLYLSAFDTLSIAYCLSQCSHLRQLHLEPITCIFLSVQCLSHLKAVLQANPHCQLYFGGSLRLSCDAFSADDAQTLSQVAVSLETFDVSVSHTDCVALSTVCSLPGVKWLNVTVLSDVKDGSGWQHVETSLSENKHLNTLWLDGCDAFIVSMLRALAMGRNTSIQDLCLYRSKPLPDDGVGALGTCVAAMAQLCKLVISHLPLPVLKALAERKEPLEYLDVRSLPGVNWDGLSEDQWKEAEEAAASATVRKVRLSFDDSSLQRSRAVQSISSGLAKNNFIRHAVLFHVPKELEESVKQTLKTVTYVYVD